MSYHRSSDDIRHDIEQTRVDMDRTLTALQSRLSTRNLWDRAKDVIEDETKRSRILQTLRVSPGVAAIAAASLAGAGASLAYLVAEGSDEETLRRKEALRNLGQLPRETAGGRMVEPFREPVGHRVKDRLVEWKDRVTGRAHEARAKAAGTAERGKEAAAEAKEKLGEAAGAARHTAIEGWHKASDAGHRAWDEAQEHPLAAAAAGVAAGVLLGVLLPSTRAEDRWMGRKRQEIVGQAKAKGAQAVEKAEHAAAQAAKEKAEEEGLPGEALAPGPEEGGEETMI